MSENGLEDEVGSVGPEPESSVQLPLAYGRPFVTLLVRDPRGVFAQWELPEETRRDALEGWRRRHAEGPGGSNGRSRVDAADRGETVLRLYDLTPGGGGFLDFSVPERHALHVRLEEPGRSLVARLGLKLSSPEEAFIPVVTSNAVHLPPGRPADAGDTGIFGTIALDPGLIFKAAPDLGRMRIPAAASTASSDFAPGRNHSRPS